MFLVRPITASNIPLQRRCSQRGLQQQLVDVCGRSKPARLAQYPTRDLEHRRVVQHRVIRVATATFDNHLHHPAFEDTLFAIEQCSGNDRICNGLPTGFFTKLIQTTSRIILLCVVSRGGKADGEERRGLRVQCRKVFGGKLDKLGRMLAAVQWPASDYSIIVFKWLFRPRARKIAQFRSTVCVPKRRSNSFSNLRGMSVIR